MQIFTNAHTNGSFIVVYLYGIMSHSLSTPFTSQSFNLPEKYYLATASETASTKCTRTIEGEKIIAYLTNNNSIRKFPSERKNRMKRTKKKCCWKQTICFFLLAYRLKKTFCSHFRIEIYLSTFYPIWKEICIIIEDFSSSVDFPVLVTQFYKLLCDLLS